MSKNSQRPLLIIHGWSDGSNSFIQLARLIEQKLGRKPIEINLADYVSMDDDVTFDDIVTAMSRAWAREKIPNQPYSVDVLVHSTGGLVVRDWLVRHYLPTKSPIKNLIMLAPANFGSQLAHRGRAFYGRIIKGFSGRKLFHVGAELLKGLELASPYSWNLAMQDRFSDQDYYGVGKVLCTVLIGNSGFSGISAAANEVGSDGTVRVACANLNCAYIEVDYSQNPLEPSYHLKQSTGQTAFGIMDEENHSTVVAKQNGPKLQTTLDHILKALKITDKEFPSWCKELANHNEIMQEYYAKKDSYKQGYQNTVVFVNDQFNNHIQDYFIEFYRSKRGKGEFETLFYQNVIQSVHAYQLDASYRSLYINCTELEATLLPKLDALHVSLIATPEFENKRNIVGYRTFKPGEFGSIRIEKQNIPDLFTANRTLLIKITLKREQADEVFRISRLRT